MRLSKELIELQVKMASRNKSYNESYEDLLEQIQTIQRKYPCEADIPEDDEFWNIKARLFSLVELKLKNELITKEPEVQEIKSTFRSRTLGKVKHESNPGIHPGDESPIEGILRNPR